MVALKHESREAGNSDMTRKGCKVLLLSVKMNILDLIKKKLHADVSKIYGNDKTSAHEIA